MPWNVRTFAAVALIALGADPAGAAEPFTILDAINQAVKTNPGVGEAAANRRATEAELRQTQGTLLPQVRLQASAGPEKLRQYDVATPNNDEYLRGRQGSVVVRQLLFDGFASINEVWRQAARVDAAAFRVLERTELIGLDAAEAYIDMVRYTKLVALAQQNLKVHLELRKNVLARFQGGRAGEGDTQQAEERVAAAEAVAAEFRLSLDSARAKYRKVVGLEPYNLRFPGRLSDLPQTKEESLEVAYKFNPTIRAAGADVVAANRAFDATTGAFLPTLALEGRATRGKETILYNNQYDEVSGKLVMSWDIFNGGQSSWRRNEAAERMIQEQQKLARLQRDALESLDKAWAARTITNDRAAALVRDVEAARRTFAAYTKEYELGQRTLVDLLNSQNQYFNASVSLVSARGVAVFADYQLLATMGQLLEYLKTGHPPEIQLVDVHPSGFIGFALAPVRLRPPGPGPEPVNAAGPVRYFESPFETAKLPRVISFDDRWASGHATNANASAIFPGPYAAAGARY
ncbi:Type I secretion outer membrane protein, TolC [Rhodopseudomonas palustris HaA2]|uniref:Type I secretion outer membrane protein, TolC n=1 Tax=Rhodopseudomonas palustris (strain HaA2) TaxID=316058 RepID=Q2IZL9_RHOP2|nr:TolC family outer membrane protein [Rhodopseudomonas palustris]ABD06341.1 Type I secretion outer membrane protein, TolC [Rhodopseudomonas palustris HaA2]